MPRLPSLYSEGNRPSGVRTERRPRSASSLAQRLLGTPNRNSDSLDDAFANLHLRANDGRRIKTNFSYRWQSNGVCTKKRRGCAAQTQHLAVGDGFEGIPECLVASSLHFAHHQHPIAPSNHIEFAAWATPVASDDRVALTLVPRGNKILGETSPRLICARPI
jgi:hypothetical protein